jgi:hypothetical protein
MFNYPVLESFVAFAAMFLIGFLCGRRQRTICPIVFHKNR